MRASAGRLGGHRPGRLAAAWACCTAAPRDRALGQAPGPVQGRPAGRAAGGPARAAARRPGQRGRGAAGHRRSQLAAALHDEELADLLEEMPEQDQIRLLASLGVERSRRRRRGDGARRRGRPAGRDAGRQSGSGCWPRWRSVPAAELRRLLRYDATTAGGLMTSQPLIVTPDTSVAEVLARIRQPGLPVTAAAQVYVCEPPMVTPTGRYLGSVGFQRLLRRAPATLVGTCVEESSVFVRPDLPESELAARLAAYNLVSVAVCDDDGRLLGAVTVDDVLDHLLPAGWREDEEADMARLSLRRSASGPICRCRADPRRWGPGMTPTPSGGSSEAIARFLGTGRFLFGRRCSWSPGSSLNTHRPHPALGPVSVHPAQPGLLDPGGLRRTADPAGPEPAGRPGPGQHRPRPRGSGADPGRHRVPGPRAGRGPAGAVRRGHHPGPGGLAVPAGQADRRSAAPGPAPRGAGRAMIR